MSVAKEKSSQDKEAGKLDLVWGGLVATGTAIVGFLALPVVVVTLGLATAIASAMEKSARRRTFDQFEKARTSNPADRETSPQEEDPENP